MTNYPPGGNPPPDQPQEPGYGPSQGSGYPGSQNPGYPGSQGPGYGTPQGPGYAGPPQGPGSGPGYDPSSGSGPGGYDPSSGSAPGYGPPPGGYDPSSGGYGQPPTQGYDPSSGPGYDPSGPGSGQQPPTWDYRQQQGQYYPGGGATAPGYALEPSRAYGNMHSQEHPVQLTVEYPEQSSRVLAGLSIPFFLLRMLMLIPALFVLYFVGIAAVVVVWISFWAVLFSGRYPPNFHNFVTGYVRWSTRCTCFLYGLTDKYPPFSLEP